MIHGMNTLTLIAIGKAKLKRNRNDQMEFSIIDAKEFFPRVPTPKNGSRLRPLKFVVDQNGYRVAKLYKRLSASRDHLLWVLHFTDERGHNAYVFDNRNNWTADAPFMSHHMRSFKTLRDVRKAIAAITSDDLNRRTEDGWINRTKLHPSTR